MGQVLAPGMHHMLRTGFGWVWLSWRRFGWHYEAWTCQQPRCMMHVEVTSPQVELLDVTYLGVVKLHSGYMTSEQVLMQYESQKEISSKKLLRVRITVNDLAQLRTSVRRARLERSNE